MNGILVAIVILTALLIYCKATRMRIVEYNSRRLQNIGYMLLGYDGKPPYTYKYGVLKWGQDMTPDQVRRMREENEIMLLYDQNGQPWKYILADTYGQWREFDYSLGRQWVKRDSYA